MKSILLQISCSAFLFLSIDMPAATPVWTNSLPDYSYLPIQLNSDIEFEPKPFINDGRGNTVWLIWDYAPLTDTSTMKLLWLNIAGRAIQTNSFPTNAAFEIIRGDEMPKLRTYNRKGLIVSGFQTDLEGNYNPVIWHFKRGYATPQTSVLAQTPIPAGQYDAAIFQREQPVSDGAGFFVLRSFEDEIVHYEIIRYKY